jgi:hypothetical protein
MAARNKVCRKIRGMNQVFSTAVGIAGVALLALSTPASAQGIFEQIFGGLRHAIEAPARLPTNLQAFAYPSTRLDNPTPQQRADIGPAKAFCVRTCDGHFFPVQARAGLSAAESCSAFCPASQTRLYSGSAIDHAVANDGSSYADLDNAFVYRQRLVAGCTCNGHDQFGLAHMDVKNDPTLRAGDVVATKSGLVAFTGTKNLGAKNNVADFTPIDTYRGLSMNSREKLSEVKIMPPNPGAAVPTPAVIQRTSDRVRDHENRSAQLSR